MKKIPVLLAGLPGNMACLVAKRIANDERYALIRHSFTGLGMGQDFQLQNEDEHNMRFNLLEPDLREIFLQDDFFKTPESEGLIIIDFTQPGATNDNCEFYCKHNLPFVMGTTGGNRDLLADTVSKSDISAVIAPNMSAPVVMLMDMIEYAAKNYPGILNNWDVRIAESHQIIKKDKSGTAIAIGKLFKKLGANYDGEGNIRDIRDLAEQILMGIPKESLGGHGWHKYSLLSPQLDVQLGFQHNISGRDTYVNGTLLAVNFLAKKITEGVQGKCYSMIDVMRG